MEIKITRYLIDVVDDTERWLTEQDVDDWVRGTHDVFPQGSYAKCEKDDDGNVIRVNFVIPRPKRAISRDMREATDSIKMYGDVIVRSSEEIADRHDYELVLDATLDEDGLDIVSE